MTLRRSRMRSIGWCTPILVAALCGSVAPAESGQNPHRTVRTTLPPLIAFEVTDLTTTAEAVTGMTMLSFDEANLSPNRVLRISVKADGDFTPLYGGSIPISNITWETSGAINGIGINGVLSKTNYTQIFQSNVNALAGQVNVVWKLQPPGPGVDGGQRQTTLRWLIEEIKP